MILLPLAVLAVDVLNVGAGRPLEDIQSAVNVAVDGDVILVDAGTYPAFGVFGKSLQILPAVEPHPGDVTVRVNGTVRVQDTLPGQTVVLDGIAMHSSSETSDPALIVANAAGPVRVQDCNMLGDLFGPLLLPGVRFGMKVVNCEDVTLTGCWARSGRRFIGNFLYEGCPAVAVTDSVFAAWDCSIVGMSSMSGASGSAGGDGIIAFGSDVLLHGCEIRAGNGGDSSSSPTSCRRNGCAGVCIRADASSVRLRGITFELGQAGSNPHGCPSDCGSDELGPLTVLTNGSTSVNDTGPSVDFSTGHSWQRSGESLTIATAGPAGYTSLLILGPETGRLVPTAPGFVGDVNVVGPLGTPRRVVLGTAPTSLQFAVPDLGPQEITKWWMQPALVGGGEIVLGPVRNFTILGSDV